MQNMLRMIGYGENLGSGFPMILDAWKQAGWGEPELKNRLEVDEVALMLPIQRFEGTVPKSDPKSDPKKLTPQARLDMIIAIIKVNPLITREEIAKSVGVGHTTIQNDLRTLRKQYGLRYEGSSKTGQWVIDKKDTQ
jgi:predicted HTH transcriptional regulator